MGYMEVNNFPLITLLGHQGLQGCSITSIHCIHSLDRVVKVMALEFSIPKWYSIHICLSNMAPQVVYQYHLRWQWQLLPQRVIVLINSPKFTLISQRSNVIQLKLTCNRCNNDDNSYDSDNHDDSSRGGGCGTRCFASLWNGFWTKFINLISMDFIRWSFHKSYNITNVEKGQDQNGGNEWGKHLKSQIQEKDGSSASVRKQWKFKNSEPDCSFMETSIFRCRAHSH